MFYSTFSVARFVFFPFGSHSKFHEDSLVAFRFSSDRWAGRTNFNLAVIDSHVAVSKDATTELVLVKDGASVPTVDVLSIHVSTEGNDSSTRHSNTQRVRLIMHFL